MSAIRQGLEDLEQEAKRGIQSIADFNQVKKKTRRLQLQVNRQLRLIRDVTPFSLGIKLFYQCAARRIKEIDTAISYEVLQIPVTSKGYGFRNRRRQPKKTDTKVVWKDVNITIIIIII